MSKKVIYFNWKMNPSSLAEARRIASAVKKSAGRGKVKTVLIPPFPYLYGLAPLTSSYCALGAQDVSLHKDGAFTGQVSATMVKKAGASYAIVGHSKRRYGLGEDDATVAKKAAAAQKARLVPIICVGEKSIMSFARAQMTIVRQLYAVLPVIKAKRVVIAYEPVWAIGGHKRTNAERAVKIITAIKDMVQRRAKKRVSVLYGGSINIGNIEKFLQYDIIDGFLVGSASVRTKEAVAIVEKVAE